MVPEQEISHSFYQSFANYTGFSLASVGGGEGGALSEKGSASGSSLSGSLLNYSLPIETAWPRIKRAQRSGSCQLGSTFISTRAILTNLQDFSGPHTLSGHTPSEMTQTLIHCCCCPSLLHVAVAPSCRHCGTGAAVLLHPRC